MNQSLKVVEIHVARSVGEKARFAYFSIIFYAKERRSTSKFAYETWMMHSGRFQRYTELLLFFLGRT